MWYNRLSEYLIKKRYKNDLTCLCIVIRKFESRFAIVAVYIRGGHYSVWFGSGAEPNRTKLILFGLVKFGSIWFYPIYSLFNKKI